MKAVQNFFYQFDRKEVSLHLHGKIEKTVVLQRRMRYNKLIIYGEECSGSEEDF